MNHTETTIEPRVSFPKFWLGFFFVAVSLLVWFFWPMKIVERVDLFYNKDYGFLTHYVDVTPLHTYVAYYVMLLSIIVGWVYWLYCIGRVHDVMAKATNGEHPVSPQRAVWAHLIPFYNLYWVFKWLAEIANTIYKRSYHVMSGKLYGIVLFLALLIQYTILMDVIYLIPSAREAFQKATGLYPLGLLNIAVILRAIALAAAVLAGMKVSKAVGRMMAEPISEEVSVPNNA